MELINRLKPYPLESLSSFLERLRRVNYYQEPYWYRKILMSGSICPDFLQMRSHYQILSNITGLSMGNILDLTVFRFRSAVESPYYHSVSLNSEDWIEIEWRDAGRFIHRRKGSQQKVCPYCWYERKAYLIPWAFRIITTCYFHKVLLVDHCTRCNKPLSIDIVNDRCKYCGLGIAQLRAISIFHDEASIQLMRCIWSIFGCTPERFPPSDLPIADSHPLHGFIRGKDFLRFLWDGGQFLIDYISEHPIFRQNSILDIELFAETPQRLRSASSMSIHRVLTVMWKILLHWPDSWISILSYMSKYNSVDEKYWTVPYILTSKFRDWRWISDAWDEFMKEAMFTNIDVIPWLRHYRRGGKENRYYRDLYTQLFSQQEAARELGVSEEKIKTFIQNDLLRVTVRAEHLSKRPWQLIEATSLEQLRIDREHHLTLAKAAKYIGTSEEQVVALVAGNLLDALNGPLIDKTASWRFEPEAVESCMKNLLGHLPILPTPKEYMQEVRYFDFIQRSVSWYGKRFVHLMKDIREGALVMYRAYDQLNLAVLWCYEADLSEYKLLLNQANGVFLSVNAVCQRLHCKPLTLRHLHEAGILIPINYNLRQNYELYQYTEEDIEIFQQQYVTAKQAADILNVTQLTIQSWARIGRLKPVTGSDINGSHEYRFEKHTILRWKNDCLSFGETMSLLGVSKATLHRWIVEGKVKPLADIGGKQRWFSREDVSVLKDEDL